MNAMIGIIEDVINNSFEYLSIDSLNEIANEFS